MTGAPDRIDVEPARRGRPRTAPDRSQARAKLIAAGLIHLTEKGYTAAGVDDILASSGVPKGSFYYHFQNKADFGLALIEAYHSYFQRKLDAALLTPDLPPLQRIKAFTDDATAGMRRHGFKRGCLVGNLGQEMGALPEEFRDRLIAVLQDWQNRVATCLELAQAEGTLAVRHDPHALAANFWIGWEGAVLRAKLERRADPLTGFADFFLEHLTS